MSESLLEALHAISGKEMSKTCVGKLTPEEIAARELQASEAKKIKEQVAMLTEMKKQAEARYDVFWAGLKERLGQPAKDAFKIELSDEHEIFLCNL